MLDSEEVKRRIEDGEKHVKANHLAHFILNLVRYDDKLRKDTSHEIASKDWRVLNDIGNFMAGETRGVYKLAVLSSPTGWVIYEYRRPA